MKNNDRSRQKNKINKVTSRRMWLRPQGATTKECNQGHEKQ
jgi:hypothetical protein